MATAEEFDELLALYESEQDPKILEKMRKNVLERNGNNDEFKTLYLDKTTFISKADCGELKEVSSQLVTMINRVHTNNLNNVIREEMLKRNKYSKAHPYLDLNNPIKK